MFGIGQRKTRSQLVREELGEGLDHIRLAASHAAGGVGATVGPRVHAARDAVTPAANRARTAAAGGIAVLTPLAAAAAEGTRQAGKMTGRMKRKEAKALRRAVGREERGMSRNRKLAGLLMIGVAAGAAGSMIMRRRRQREEDQWTTHESSTARSATDAARQMAENAKDGMQSGQARASGAAAGLHSATESAKDTVKSAADAARSTAERAMHSASSDSEPKADRMAASDRLLTDPATPSTAIRPGSLADAGSKPHGDPLSNAQDRWSTKS